MRKNVIKIAGAGLAGLTAAINLAKADYQVEVYERCSKVGGCYPENPQLLPNWFQKQDVIEELEACNIKLNWLRKINQVEVNLPENRVIFFAKKISLGYTVLRGGENSMEKNFVSQAENLGVEIIANSPVDADSVDIAATGAGQAITVGYGRVYKGNYNPGKVKISLNPSYTPSIGYCYFFPHNENIATVKISKKVGERVDLAENLQKFQAQHLNPKTKEENFLYEFRTKRSFEIPESAVLGNTLLAGEAAGFQDELFRFGMRYAILSGYLAARSIIEGLDYNVLWKKKFQKEFQRTARARKLFEKLKKQGFTALPKNKELYIDIEKFAKLWLSNKASFVLTLPFSLQQLFLNKFFLRALTDFLRS